MGKLLEKFKEIDKEIDNDNKKEIDNNNKIGYKLKLKRKFDEIINFLSNKSNTVSSLSPEDYATEDGAAYVVAKLMKDKIKINQLRKIFTQIKKIEAELKSEKEDKALDNSIDKIILLLPEIAYAYGRDLINEDFYNLLKLLLSKDKLKTVKDFRTLVKFLSAVIAYYKMLS